MARDEAAAFRASLVFERLSQDHEAMFASFHCHARIDEYLKVRALEDLEAKRSVSWVLIHQGNYLVAYISLAMGSVILGEPERAAHSLPGKAEYPGVLIGQLGTDEGYLRRGLAKRLLKFAVGEAAKMAEIVGCRVLIAEVNMEEPAMTMYREAGFERSTAKHYRQETTTQTHFFDVFSNPRIELGVEKRDLVG